MSTNAKNLVSDEMVQKAWEAGCIGDDYGHFAIWNESQLRKAIERIALMLAQAGDVRRKCPMCRGVGSHGEPPMPCRWCKGTRNDGLQSQAGDARIPMPTSEDMAVAMEQIGYAWLKENAPHRLTQAGDAVSEPVAWMSSGGDVSRSKLWCDERTGPNSMGPIPLYIHPPLTDKESK